jgi:hypothetical protein
MLLLVLRDLQILKKAVKGIIKGIRKKQKAPKRIVYGALA